MASLDTSSNMSDYMLQSPWSTPALPPVVEGEMQPTDDESMVRPGCGSLFSQAIRRQNVEVPKMAAPCPRFGHTAVVHNDTMVVFAGRDAKCYNDIWEYSFLTRGWREVLSPSQSKPKPRAGHTAVVYQGKMYVFGGVSDHGVGIHTLWLNDLWSLDLSTWEWSRIHLSTLPPKRKGHTALVYRDAMYIFGGGQDDKNIFGDMWAFDFLQQSWTRCFLHGDPPKPRMYHVSVGAFGYKMLIFGGRTPGSTPNGFLNDVYEVDLHTLHSRKLYPKGTAPTQRMCSTAIFHNSTLAIFTGGSSSYLEDTHQLDLRKMEWSCVDSVSLVGRTRPTTVKWKNTVLTFGGCVHGNGYVNDCVELELEPMSLAHCVREFIHESEMDVDPVAQGLPERVQRFLALSP
eukprot:Sspe_Gene.59061::Locus_32433_Transcript_1_1_Confidence_1.000_Length_1586::g.59061::m.59061